MTVKDRTTLLVKGLERICADIAAIASLLEDAGNPDEPATEHTAGTTAASETETAGKAAAKPGPKTRKAGKATTKAAAPESETADEAAAKAEPVPEPESVPEKVYTYEETRAILAEKARTGFRAEVKAILTRYGVNQLSEIKDPKTFAAIVAEAEEIKIG